MRKQTKLAVVLSAAALLVLGASMTSFAAKGWTADGDDWYYLDNNGDAVIETWKSYNGNYYYLGEDGVMVKDALVDDGDNTFYVDANGAMVKNKWVAVPADEDEEFDVEYRWYRFGSTGKALKSGKKTVEGKKYAFDGDGKMVFGFVDSDAETILNNDDDPLLNCTYYFGSNDDGSMHTGWVQYVDGFEDDAYDGDSYWFYFNTSTGKKTVATDKSIDGKKYVFDGNGVMKTGWYNATSSTTNNTTNSDFIYLSGDDEGFLQKNSWIWAVPGEGQLATDEDNSEDTAHWYRTDGQGHLIKDTTKKIGGKWYVFDQYGTMKNGLVELQSLTEASDQRVNNAKILQSSLTDLTGDQILAMRSALGETETSANLYYFSDDEENDGSMKTGTVSIELADDTYTFAFDKTSGRALNGVNSNKLYRNGMLRSAGDDRYTVDYAVLGTDSDAKTYYLVGSTGTVIKAGKYFKDADDNYYATYKVYVAANTTQTVIAKFDGALDNANKYAKAFASKYLAGSFTDDGVTYTVLDYLKTNGVVPGETGTVNMWNFPATAIDLIRQ